MENTRMKRTICCVKGMRSRYLLLLSVLLLLLTGCGGAPAKKQGAPLVVARQGYVYSLTPTDFTVYQVPLASGKSPLFHQSLQTNLRSRIVSRVGGGVYLAMDGALSAWTQGKQVWMTPINDEVQAMTATARTVFLVTSQQVLSLNAVTGKPIWQQEYATGGLFASQVCVIVLSSLVIVAQGENVQAFDAVTGQTRWAMLLPTAGDGEIITSVTGAGTTVVFCTGTALVAVNILTGQTRWQQDDQALLSSVSEDGATLYLPFQETPRISLENGSQSHTQTGVEAVNLLSGVVQWRDIFALKATEMGTVTNQYLCWISTDGTMTTWRLSDGKQLWHTTRRVHPVAFTVNLFDQSVVVQDNQGEVDSLALFDGSTQWRHVGSVKDLATGTIQIDAHAIYVLDANTLHALPHSGGRDIWSLTLNTPMQWDIESFA